VSQVGGELRAGENRYTTSVIALEMATGKLKWTYQLTHHDIWEMDVATPVILYTAKVDNKPRKALAVMRTDGLLFRLDRETGAPIAPIEERPVKQDIRLHTWPTQPFPLGVDRFGPECVDAATAPPGFKLGCYFDPMYYDKPDVLLPFINVRHAPMSYNPLTGDFYVVGMVTPWWYRRLENPVVMVVEHPPMAKEYGIFGAINAQTGKIRWEQRSPWGLASGSGTLATTGDVLFHMEGDGTFEANDAKTGKVLWKFQTGSLPLAAPLSLASGVPAATFEERGEQYVTVVSGKLLWAFKLGGKIPSRAAPSPPSSEYDFTGAIKRLSTDGAGEISVGSLIRTRETTFDPYTFSPQRARAKVGSTVRWTNFGVTTYTITSSDATWSTGPIAPGESQSVVFNQRGTYIYFSKEYPFMKGELYID
jgi:alcohol dehydrogenase (cytochrome c)